MKVSLRQIRNLIREQAMYLTPEDLARRRGGVPMGISQKHWQKLTDTTSMQESAEKQLRLFVEKFIKGSSLT